MDNRKKELPLPGPDLTGYYTKAQIDALLAGFKWNTSTYPHGPVMNIRKEWRYRDNSSWVVHVVTFADGYTIDVNTMY